jgi:SAM-dependent methyltransferase
MRYISWVRTPPEIRTLFSERSPCLEPYERLAAVYHHYARHCTPDYPAYLTALARTHSFPVRAVLDLACGPGFLTGRLAGRFISAVGLDRSEAVLAEARRRHRARFVWGDFRDFHLGEQFDALVCASDSLNYVAEPGELRAVCRCAAEHLRPGGFFVFDALSERACRRLSDKTMTFTDTAVRYHVAFHYDPASRVEEALVLLADGVERHRRVPIEPRDVFAGAAGTGLSVLDHFGGSLFGLMRWGALRTFYVLRKCRAGS